jgi:hypothetical protein
MGTGILIRSIAGSLAHGRRTRIRPVHRSDAESTVLSSVTLLAVFLMAILIVLMLAVVALLSVIYSDGYPNPFISYGTIRPGESLASVIEQQPCRRMVFVPGSTGMFSCVINPDSETIDSIIVISRDGRIQQVEFLPTNLQAIQLLRRWGRPDRIQRVHQSYVLSWDEGVIAHVPAGGQFSYLLPVRSVLLRSGT